MLSMALTDVILIAPVVIGQDGVLGLSVTICPSQVPGLMAVHHTVVL